MDPCTKILMEKLETGTLLVLCLTIQNITGIFLAVHYTPNAELAYKWEHAANSITKTGDSFAFELQSSPPLICRSQEARSLTMDRPLRAHTREFNRESSARCTRRALQSFPVFRSERCTRYRLSRFTYRLSKRRRNVARAALFHPRFSPENKRAAGDRCERMVKTGGGGCPLEAPLSSRQPKTRLMNLQVSHGEELLWVVAGRRNFKMENKVSLVSLRWFWSSDDCFALKFFFSKQTSCRLSVSSCKTLC